MGVPGPRLSPEFSPVIESTEFGRSFPSLVAVRHGLANLLAHPDLIRPARHVHLEGRHSSVLADRAFALGGLIDIQRDDLQRLGRLRARLLGSHRTLHGRSNVGRQIGRRSDDQVEHAVEKPWKHPGSIDKVRPAVDKVCLKAETTY